MNHESDYKGFKIEGLKTPKGFNVWKFTATAYENKGYQEENFYSIYLNTQTSSIKEGLKELKAKIDLSLKEGLKYSSNGLIGCPYLPSIHKNHTAQNQDLKEIEAVTQKAIMNLTKRTTTTEPRRTGHKMTAQEIINIS